MSPPPSPLAKKLLIRPGAAVWLVNAPAGMAQRLEPLPPGTVLLDAPRPDVDTVLVFAAHAADLDRLVPQALASVRRDGLLWIAYPKGGAKAGTDLNRDLLHAAMAHAHGWTGVTLVAADERWSAMRFRPRELVGT